MPHNRIWYYSKARSGIYNFLKQEWPKPLLDKQFHFPFPIPHPLRAALYLIEKIPIRKQACFADYLEGSCIFALDTAPEIACIAKRAQVFTN